MAQPYVTVFWGSLSLAFLAMAVLSYRLRNHIPKVLEQSAVKKWVSGPDPRDLRPIFTEMLLLEIIAFCLTSVAAAVSGLTT